MKFLNILLLASCFIGCRRGKECPDFQGYQVPESLFFKLQQNGQRLPDSVLNNLKIFYYSESAKQYLTDFKRSIFYQPPSNSYQLDLMVTREIALRSGNDNIKDFYLEFPGGDIDTLYVDYRKLAVCEADTSQCYCLYPRQRVIYNQISVTVDTADPFKTALLFIKK